MKGIRYFLFSAWAACAIAGCGKPDLSLPPEGAFPSGGAMFQLTYVEPLEKKADNAIDSVLVNDILVSGSTESGQLAVNGTCPFGSSEDAGAFYQVEPGNVNIKFYRKDSMVYNRTVSLKEGKYELFVYRLDMDPVILDWGAPVNETGQTSTGVFSNNPVTRIRFYNFAFQEYPGTPYSGPLQYQVRNENGSEWFNVGEPVGFAEATEYQDVTILNTSGSEKLSFRVLTEAGVVLKVWNGSRYVDAADQWTALSGTYTRHICCGVIAGKPKYGYIRTSPIKY